MADSEPTLMSGGQSGSTDAVEMKKIENTQPSVPAKDDPIGADDSNAKGKDKQATMAATSSSNRQERTDSLSIGAADAPANPDPVDGLVCNITLLLPTGARHPFKLDERYLAKRNVEVPEITEHGKKDPFSVSVYKLKELILREWRDEWDGKPASPSSIRLIHFGKLLDDKEPLKKYRFSSENPNVVHMSVKPAELLEDDEAGKGKSSSSGGRNSEGGSGCCVIL
ncbi:hypothetical protein N0V82_004996 [Gnomoniopsis sp. IMI 355080]|nr:hypothetical protein N0V82_004996 [Gnomoniopsis sp. IMI 355080]